MQLHANLYRAALLGITAIVAACDGKGPTSAAPPTECPASADVDHRAALRAAGLMPVAPEAPVPLHLQMDPADVDTLYARDPRSDDRLPGVAALGDAPAVPLHGLRFRGSSSRLLPKKSFNIRFDDPQELLYGSARMNANAMYTDASMMRERLAFDMFHTLGQPASRTRYLDLHLNGIFEGLYLHIERVDENLLANAGLNPEGTLVRDDFRSVRFDDPRIARNSAFGFAISEIPDEEREALLAGAFRSRGSPHWPALVELVAWVEQASPGRAFEAGFRERFDVDNFIDWLAVNFLIGDFDSFADDYWLYLDHEADDARWKIIPWDHDLSFGSHWRPEPGTTNDYYAYERPVGSEFGNRLVRHVLRTTALRHALDCRMRELMETVFTADYFHQAVALIDEPIRPSVMTLPSHGNAFERHPTNHHSQQDMRDRHIATLIDFVLQRHAFLASQVAPADGALDIASVSTAGKQAGDLILLTDPAGWTIAELELLSTPEESGTVTASVMPENGLDGVDRRWTLVNHGADLEVRLSLFYRNDIPQLIAPRSDNWVTASLQPVGTQWDLVMARATGNQFDLLPDSWVNPYSNRVTAAVTLEGGAGSDFVIISAP